MFQSPGKHEQAKEYYEKALVNTTEISDRREAPRYGKLGTAFQSLGKYNKASITKERLPSELRLAKEKERQTTPVT